MADARASGQKDQVTAITDAETGDVDASAVFDIGPMRLFRALTTEEICDWWVRPGVFDTQTWSGDVREGGHWTAAGVGGGQPYRLEGEFLTVDEPHSLAHTWKPVGAPIAPATLTYHLDARTNGVLLTLRHSGLPNAEVRERTRAGWETSLVRLQEIISAERG